jgi:DNA-binding response OmpR family regulator
MLYMNIIIISARPDFWQNLTPAMQERGFAAILATSFDEAMASMRLNQVKLVIIDLLYNFESIRSSVAAIEAANSRVKIAVVNNLRKNDFKDATAKLHNVLMSIPVNPRLNDINVLLNTLAISAV